MSARTDAADQFAADTMQAVYDALLDLGVTKAGAAKLRELL